MKNLSGGVQRGTEVLNNLDLTVRIDTATLGLPLDGTFFLYVLSNFGGSVTSLVGDIQTTSNIEAPSTVKLFEAWYEHRFARGSVRLGLQDYNSEFAFLDYAQTLLNSSFGIGPEIAQADPSIFPTTALGGRGRWEPTDGTYLMFGAYDGVPGDPDEDRRTHVHLRRQDGIFYALEVGLEADTIRPHLGLGFWYRDTDYVDLSGKRRTHNGGLYLLAETSLLGEEDPAQELGGFLQIGITRGDRNEIEQYIGAGLTVTGLLPSRDLDVLSVGVAHARSSSALRRVREGAHRAETAFELTYRAEICPGLAIQPDVQVVLHPSFDPSLDDAVLVGLRVQMSF
jgi:porin